MINSDERMNNFLNWHIPTFANRFLGKVQNYEITVKTVVDNTNYSITVNNDEITVNSGVSATAESILILIKNEITDYDTILGVDSLQIVDNKGVYFSLKSSDFYIENIEGVIAIRKHNNAKFEEELANFKPPYPFFSYNISTGVETGNEVKFEESGDTYTISTNNNIDIDCYSDENNYKDLLKFVLSALKFEEVRMKIRLVDIAIGNERPIITDLSSILGGGSQQRANSMFNLSTTDTVVDTGIVGTEEIDASFTGNDYERDISVN